VDDVVVLPRAFAHRDSAHPRPLADALAAGFTAVEVDVWLRGGRLLVGHDEAELDPAVTLGARYLAPIAELARSGSLLPPAAGPLLLVLDVKTSALATHRAVGRELVPYADVLTRWTGGRLVPGPVRVLLSGHRARSLVALQRDRLAACDGRLADLGRLSPGHLARLRGGVPAEVVPMVSADWGRVVDWDGNGPVPARARRRLVRIVTAAHAQGRAVRFWATPDTPGPAREAVWSLLCQVGVDAVNTDDLRGLARFLRNLGEVHSPLGAPPP